MNGAERNRDEVLGMTTSAPAEIKRNKTTAIAVPTSCGTESTACTPTQSPCREDTGATARVNDRPLDKTVSSNMRSTLASEPPQYKQQQQQQQQQTAVNNVLCSCDAWRGSGGFTRATLLRGQKGGEGGVHA